MNGFPKLVVLALVVAATTTVPASTLSAATIEPWTQTAQAPPPARPAPRTPAAPAPAGQPATNGSPAPPATPTPTRTEILNFDNWIVTCNDFAEGPRPRVCSALLQIAQQNTNQVVFAWTIAIDNSKQMVTIMQTPTGVNIPPGVELRVGKVPPRKIPFASCDTGRCIATLPMDTALLREMTTVPNAEAVIQGSQGNTVQFNIQMKGFDKAYAVMSR